MATKVNAEQKFPEISVPKFGGGTLDLAKPKEGMDWKLVIVYRGKHCPICARYLTQMNELLPAYNEEGIDVVAVSADSLARAEEQIPAINPAFDVGYDLSIDQMQELGLYISNPRSPQESDRPFSEPGFFLINSEGNIQIVDISNAPFARPDLNTVLGGIKFIRNPENNYPVRGTYN